MKTLFGLILAISLSFSNLFAELVEKTVIVDGQEVEVVCKIKTTGLENIHFVKNVVPEIMAEVGNDAKYYVAQIGYVKEKGWDVYPDLCMVEMKNGKAVKYWEIKEYYFEDLHMDDYPTVILAFADIQPGDKVACDDSFGQKAPVFKDFAVVAHQQKSNKTLWGENIVDYFKYQR